MCQNRLSDFQKGIGNMSYTFDAHLSMRWWLLWGSALSYSPSTVPTTYAPSPTLPRSQNPALLYAPSLVQPIDATEPPITSAVPTHCTDDLTWFKLGTPSKSCAWVARSIQRCDTLGEDRRFAYMVLFVLCLHPKVTYVYTPPCHAGMSTKLRMHIDSHGVSIVCTFCKAVEMSQLGISTELVAIVSAGLTVAVLCTIAVAAVLYPLKRS